MFNKLEEKRESEKQKKREKQANKRKRRKNLANKEGSNIEIMW